VYAQPDHAVNLACAAWFAEEFDSGKTYKSDNPLLFYTNSIQGSMGGLIIIYLITTTETVRSILSALY
jgi:lipid-A-disaccharide synthase-like uncharacterized protein